MNRFGALASRLCGSLSGTVQCLAECSPFAHLDSLAHGGCPGPWIEQSWIVVLYVCGENRLHGDVVFEMVVLSATFHIMYFISRYLKVNSTVRSFSQEWRSLVGT